MNISNWINSYRHEEGPPREKLGPFMRWCLSGAWPALWLAAFLSAVAGVLEAGTALILGRVIDATAQFGPNGFFAPGNMGLIIGALVFFVLARPVLYGLSSAANAIIVQPNVNPLVLSRLHRWTLGQAVTFFDDDFAGRIAQKQMQAARLLLMSCPNLSTLLPLHWRLWPVRWSCCWLLIVELRWALGFG